MPTDAAELDSIEKRMNEIHALIKEMGGQADLYRAKTAGALGGGVFTAMLALGAAYDLATGNSSVQIGLGVSRSTFIVIAIALAIASIGLFALAAMRERNRDNGRAAQLDELEEEFARLLDRKNAIVQPTE